MRSDLFSSEKTADTTITSKSFGEPNKKMNYNELDSGGTIIVIRYETRDNRLLRKLILSNERMEGILNQIKVDKHTLSSIVKAVEASFSTGVKFPSSTKELVIVIVAIIVQILNKQISLEMIDEMTKKRAKL